MCTSPGRNSVGARAGDEVALILRNCSYSWPGRRKRLRLRTLACMGTATLAAISYGCAGHVITKSTALQGAARPVARDATREELVERYNLLARNVQTLNATVELRPTAG